ncbi:outer membrane protein assembly factor BamD [Phaeodactylibacter luteus]|uniref:Outer membrane protein assembly factor BamD n=1 Tax=Phaeodactylibacter luteus TaxID=1564516 RepID=A0A5C6RLN5_9BACT|nr:outer membrane protein assembly factor BamD [Phaeodactylibacter luteus]TXB62540.1 outer membrane protein assembly factor BamD [Phaeodactylibacter luteus]
MKKILFLATVGLSLMLSSCKSEFEKIRTGGDVDRIYEKAFAYYEAEDYQKAQALFEIIISSYRGKKEAEEIYFKYAYTYYKLEQYILAAYYFKNFATTYGTSDLRQEAEFMSAYSNYQLSPSFRLDQQYTDQAIEGFQLFVNTYPNSERVEQCNKLIDAMRAKLELKAFEAAKLYFNLREYQAAIQTFENVLKDFPDTQNAEEIEYMAIRSAYLLANNSFVEKQKERFEDAVERAEEFLSRYTDSRFGDEVAKMYEDSKEQLKALDNVRYQDESARVRS